MTKYEGLIFLIWRKNSFKSHKNQFGRAIKGSFSKVSWKAIVTIPSLVGRLSSFIAVFIKIKFVFSSPNIIKVQKRLLWWKLQRKLDRLVVDPAWLAKLAAIRGTISSASLTLCSTHHLHHLHAPMTAIVVTINFQQR